MYIMNNTLYIYNSEEEEEEEEEEVEGVGPLWAPTKIWPCFYEPLFCPGSSRDYRQASKLQLKRTTELCYAQAFHISLQFDGCNNLKGMRERNFQIFQCKEKKMADNLSQ